MKKSTKAPAKTPVKKTVSPKKQIHGRHPHHEAHNIFMTFLVLLVVIQSGIIFWLYTNGGQLPWN